MHSVAVRSNVPRLLVGSPKIDVVVVAAVIVVVVVVVPTITGLRYLCTPSC